MNVLIIHYWQITRDFIEFWNMVPGEGHSDGWRSDATHGRNVGLWGVTLNAINEIIIERSNRRREKRRMR